MIENEWIRFNPAHWGYDFVCEQCGAAGETDGEAPISAMDAMMEKGWKFAKSGEKHLPLCPGCAEKQRETIPEI